MATGFPDYSIGFLGAITVPNGGTGLGTVPVGALLTGNGTGPLIALATGTFGQTLTSAGALNPPQWSDSLTLKTLEITGAPINATNLVMVTTAGQTVDIADIGPVGGPNYLTIDKNGNVIINALSLGNPLPLTSGGTGVASCTAGQILIGSGANTAAFSTPPGARVYNSTNVTQIGVGGAYLTFDTERYNRGPMHSTMTNTGRLTSPKAGVYFIGADIYFNGAAGFRYLAFIVLNHTTTICQVEADADAGGFVNLPLSTTWLMSVNDYVEVAIYTTNTGTTIIPSFTDYSQEFFAQWLGP